MSENKKNFKEIQADYELNFEEAKVEGSSFPHPEDGTEIEKIMVPVVPVEELEFADNDIQFLEEVAAMNTQQYKDNKDRIIAHQKKLNDRYSVHHPERENWTEKQFLDQQQKDNAYIAWLETGETEPAKIRAVMAKRFQRQQND